MVRRVCRAAFGVAAFFAAASLMTPARADDVAATVPTCNACHGEAGRPVAPNIPAIAGQESNYLYKELHDFHSGARTSPIMTAQVKDISLEDLRKLADLFAAKTWPAPAAAAPAPLPAIAAKIDMCKACHQPHFEGGAPAPRLAGLSRDYLLAAMNGFADGSRTNNLDMPGFMKVLSESDREAIAAYLAGL